MSLTLSLVSHSDSRVLSTGEPGERFSASGFAVRGFSTAGITSQLSAATLGQECCKESHLVLG